MAGLPLQHHILDHAVTVAVDGGRVLPPGVQDNLTLEGPRRGRRRAHIVRPVPAGQVLLHRLPVEKDHRHVRRLGLVHDDGGGGAVHQVHAQHVIALLQKAVHLLVLGGLAGPGVRQVQVDLDAPALFLRPGQLLQLLDHGGDKGVLLLVEGHADAHGGRLLLPAAAGQKKRRKQTPGEDPPDGLVHPVPPLPYRVTGKRSFSCSGSYMVSLRTTENSSSCALGPAVPLMAFTSISTAR